MSSTSQTSASGPGEKRLQFARGDGKAHAAQEPFPLTSHDIERFDADGFIILSNVLAPDLLERYEPVITAKVLE